MPPESAARFRGMLNMQVLSPWLVWCLVGLGLLLFELAVPGFVIFFFGLGALATGLACLVFEVSLNGQLLIFIIFSLLSLVLLRRFVKRAFTGDSENSFVDEPHAAKGELVTVETGIVPPAEGKIRYSGTTWRARAHEPIEAGRIVEIVEQDGLVMVVKPVVENKEQTEKTNG